MKILKLSVVAIALVLGVAGSAFTSKVTDLYWFTTGTETILNSGAASTVAAEESILPGGASFYNTTSGTPVVDGYLSIDGDSKPVNFPTADVTIYHN